MGLNIRIIKNLREIQKLENIEEHYENDDIVVGNNSGFQYQLGSLKNGSVYTGEHYDSFSAGSYSGYSLFRKSLLSLVDDIDINEYWLTYGNFINEKYTNYHRESKLNRILDETRQENIINVYQKPFIELLYFSDCEGIIGPEVCKKLYEDFVKYQEVAKEKMIDWHYEVYMNFMEGLKTVSESNGVLQYC